MTSSKDGFARLGDLVGELETLGKKREIAVANGATDAQLSEIDTLISDLKTAIAEAAAAEIEREVEEAKKEAGRLKRGRPKKPCPADNSPANPTPPNPPTPPTPPTPGGGGGGGAGGAGGAGGGFFGIPDAPNQAPGTQQIPPAQCVFTRSEDTVWAWNRFLQEWMQQDFNGPIQQVTAIGGGLLVVALNEAAIFDCTVAEWLTMMRTDEVLLLGNATPGTALPSTPAPTPIGASPVPANAIQPQPSGGSADFGSPSGAPDPSASPQPVPGTNSPIPNVAGPATFSDPLTVPMIPDPLGGAPAGVPDPATTPNVVTDPEPPLAFPAPPDPDPNNP